MYIGLRCSGRLQIIRSILMSSRRWRTDPCGEMYRIRFNYHRERTKVIGGTHTGCGSILTQSIHK